MFLLLLPTNILILILQTIRYQLLELRQTIANKFKIKNKNIWKPVIPCNMSRFILHFISGFHPSFK